MHELDCLRQLVVAFFGTTGAATASIPVSHSVTPNFAAPTAGTTTAIPVGAIGAGILILTGTGTINGVDWPAGVPWNEANKLTAPVTLILGTPGTARIYYGT